MARIGLRCSCGWNFFVPPTVQGWEVACPSCAKAVPIPGRKPGERALSPGEVAGLARRRRALRTWVTIGAAAALGAAGFFLFTGRSEDRPTVPAEAPRKAVAPPPPPVTRVTPAVPASPSAPPPAPAARSGPDEAELTEIRRAIARGEALLNVAGLVSEILRLRGGFTQEHGKLLARMAEIEARIQKDVTRLAVAGRPAELRPRFKPGDRLLSFGSRGLWSMTPVEAAGMIASWVRAMAPGTIQECVLDRGPERVTVYVVLPELDDEFRALAELAFKAAPDPGTVPPPLPGASSAEPEPRQRFPEALVAEIRRLRESLPPDYVKAFPEEDRVRMERLLEEGEGEARDHEFLKERILGDLLARCRREQTLFRARAAELEAKARDQVSGDVVHFKNGRKVEGKVEEETDEFVRVRSRVGSVRIPREEVARIERGKGAGASFWDRYSAAAGKAEALAELMEWCKANNLKLERDLVAYQLLAVRPLDGRVRAELGLPAPLAPPDTPPELSRPDASPQQRDAAVARAVEKIAAEAVEKLPTFGEVILEVRRLTEGFRYSQLPAVPARSMRGASFIGDPLNFRPQDLVPQAQEEISAWWSALGREDRREFARFFGLWCAHARHGADPK